MGLKIGKFLKNATRVRFDSHTLGNLARNAGTVAGAAVGGVPGALIAGGTSAARTLARPGANIGDALKAGAGDAATAYGVNKVGQLASNALHIPQSVASMTGPSQVAGGVADVAGGAPTASGGGFLSGIPQAIKSFLPSVGGLSGLLDKGLGAAQVVNAADLQRQSTGYAKDALNSVNASYNARAPLRVAGIEGLLHPQTPDLSSLSQIPGNPFAKRPMPIPKPVQAPATGPEVVYG